MGEGVGDGCHESTIDDLAVMSRFVGFRPHARAVCESYPEVTGGAREIQERSGANTLSLFCRATCAGAARWQEKALSLSRTALMEGLRSVFSGSVNLLRGARGAGARV